jgi:hypothetical protein
MKVSAIRQKPNPPKPAAGYLLTLGTEWAVLREYVTILHVTEVAALFPVTLIKNRTPHSGAFFGLTDVDTLVLWSYDEPFPFETHLDPQNGGCYDLFTWHEDRWLDGIWLPENKSEEEL